MKLEIVKHIQGDSLKFKNLLLLFLALIVGSGCTTIVTAPIEITGAVVSTTFDMVGSAGGAVVNTLTGGSSNKDDD